MLDPESIPNDHEDDPIPDEEDLEPADVPESDFEGEEEIEDA